MMNLAHYQALFRASPYPYLVLAPDLTIIGASEAYLRSVRRTAEELMGQYLFDAFPEDPSNPGATDTGEVKGSLLRALAKGEPDTTAFVRYAIPVETPAGTVFEERYWSTVHTPVLDADGVPFMVVQNAIDVTELYRFDEQSQVATVQLTGHGESNADNFNRAQLHGALSRILNNERQHLRSLFNQSPGFVAVLMGPKHVFEMVNEAYYQLVGHRELIGKALWEALPEVAGQGYEEFLDRVYHTGEAWRTRAMPIAVQRLRAGPVEQRYIDLVYEPYRDRYGTTVGIFAQGYDVTDAVEAQAAKLEADARLKDGMDAAKMVVWDWHLGSDTLAYSENIGVVLGIVPPNMQELSACVHRDDQARVDAAHRRAIDGAGAYEEIVRFIRPDDGAQIWVASHGKVQYDSEGRPARVRGVTVDVTQRYEAEHALREAGRKKDEFLAMLAHELRNPLAPISSAAEMLKLVAQNDERVRRSSEVILRQVKHMTALVDDLLDVSRVTRGLVELNRAAVDIETVVGSAIEQVRPLIDARRHTLTLRMRPAPRGGAFVVDGDRTRLVQVLANLLNNAAKYTPQNGAIVLEVGAGADAGQVEIAVTDNGIGIDGRLLPHVFELFTQAERTPDRSQGGLGIGLALVKNMVALHGGSVSASSAGPGTGSTFTIALPLLAAAQDEPAHPAGVQQAAPAPPGLRIMLVDDNVDAAEALSTLLEMLGHAVTVHAHPLDAIEAAQQQAGQGVAPEVFILDIGLPEMDGYALARRLRDGLQPAQPRPTFIALSGYGQENDRLLSQAAGFDRHFVKPMDTEVLLQVLAAVPRSP
jgi:PAS domain S-box-containing protein